MRGTAIESRCRSILAALVCAVCVGATSASSAADDPNVVGPAFGKSFTVAVESVEVSASSGVDIADDTAACAPPRRTITIALRFEIPDANRPVAIDTYPPAVLGAWDALGQEIAFQTERTSDLRKYADSRCIFAGEDGHCIEARGPAGINIELVLDPNQPVPSALSRLEGTICVLYAEDVIMGDVPFEVTGEWIEVNEDLQIAVSPKTPPAPGPITWEVIPGMEDDPYRQGYRSAEPIALWTYETYARSTMGGHVLTLDMAWNPGRTASNYVLIETGLTEADGVFAIPFQQFAAPVSDGCGCSGRLEQDNNNYDAIRHVFAVHPVEVRVPFALTDVPIPAL